MSIMKIACDIDGCIADPCEYVRRYLREPKKNWAAYFEHTLDLPRIDSIADLVQSLHSSGNLIFFVTGRPESNRSQTLEWLRRNMSAAGSDSLLVMRKNGDHRKSYEVKLSWYKAMKPDLIIEDEPDAVEAAKAAGFRGVLQVHGYRLSERDAIPGEQGEMLV